jgi:hypothetical protein
MPIFSEGVGRTGLLDFWKLGPATPNASTAVPSPAGGAA